VLYACPDRVVENAGKYYARCNYNAVFLLSTLKVVFPLEVYGVLVQILSTNGNTVWLILIW